MNDFASTEFWTLKKIKDSFWHLITVLCALHHTSLVFSCILSLFHWATTCQGRFFSVLFLFAPRASPASDFTEAFAVSFSRVLAPIINWRLGAHFNGARNVKNIWYIAVPFLVTSHSFECLFILGLTDISRYDSYIVFPPGNYRNDFSHYPLQKLKNSI